MLYSTYMHEAMKLTIVDDFDASGYSYLEPNYRVLLLDANMNPEQVKDHPITWEELESVLRLEVERRNRVSDRSRYVIDWIFNVITTTVDPTIIGEENELMKNMMDYMKLNHELKDKEQALQDREANLEHKEELQETRGNVLQLVPGMNFSKRGTN